MHEIKKHFYDFNRHKKQRPRLQIFSIYIMTKLFYSSLEWIFISYNN